MPASERDIERVRKLLRLAAPDSGATEPERASAAVEAARLIHELGLYVGAAPLPIPRAPRKRAAAPPSSPYREVRPGFYQYQHESPISPIPSTTGSWERGIATQPAACSDSSCNGAIEPGDRVWRRVILGDTQYLHADGPCRW